MNFNHNIIVGLGIILPCVITLVCCLLFLICAFRHGCSQPCWFSKRSAANEAQQKETLAAANRSYEYKAASPTGDHTITHSITQHSDLCRSTTSNGSGGGTSVAQNFEPSMNLEREQTYQFEEDELDAISWDKYKMRESMYAHLSSLAQHKEVSEMPTAMNKMLFPFGTTAHFNKGHPMPPLFVNQYRFSLESSPSHCGVNLNPQYNIHNASNQEVSFTSTISNRRDAYIMQPFPPASKIRHHHPIGVKQSNMINSKDYENRSNLSCNSPNGHHPHKLLLGTVQKSPITLNSLQFNANHRISTIRAQTHLEQST